MLRHTPPVGTAVLAVIDPHGGWSVRPGTQFAAGSRLIVVDLPPEVPETDDELTVAEAPAGPTAGPMVGGLSDAPTSVAEVAPVAQR